MIACLQAQSISVKQGSAYLLRDVSLQVQPGELSVIVGPNGAGKTTLLQALVGLWPLAQGAVQVQGQALATFSRQQLAKRCIYLSQQFELSFDFSVADIVRMGRYPYRHDCSAAEQEQAVRQALQQLDLAKWGTRRYSSLSGGERQRVQLARIVAQCDDHNPSGPRCVLLDESNAHLDLLHQQELLQMLKYLCQQGFGVVAVVHDLNWALQHADRVVVLNHGKVVAEGSPEVLTPALAAEVFQLPFVQLQDQRGRQWLLP